MSAPTVVQYVDGHSVGSLAFPNPVAKGNTVVVFANAGLVASGVTDTLGNQYPLFQFGMIASLYDYAVAICPASKSTGANTVALNSILPSGWAIAEISASVIQTQSGIGTGGTSPTFAGVINELLVGCLSLHLTPSRAWARVSRKPAAVLHLTCLWNLKPWAGQVA